MVVIVRCSKNNFMKWWYPFLFVSLHKLFSTSCSIELGNLVNKAVVVVYIASMRNKLTSELTY